MAIAQGAGTEIIRSAMFADVDGGQKLILGEQHQIYTVLSIIVYCNGLNATTDTCIIRMVGWDNHAGAGAAEPVLCLANPQANETWVWNDKFSFNGYEPTGMSGTLSTTAEQTALAAQGGSVAQSLEVSPTHTDDDYDIFITYIDQNNS